MKAATFLSLALGLAASCVYGDARRRRKLAEAYACDLEQQIEVLSLKTPPSDFSLRRMALILNDAHKKISAVSKTLQKPAVNNPPKKIATVSKVIPKPAA